MTPDQRKWLKDQIHVKMRREPNVSLAVMRNWILEDPSEDWRAINRKTLNSFLSSNMDKYRRQGNLKRKPGGGPPEISLRKAAKITKLALNKRFRGSRTVAARVGVSHSTVKRYLKRIGAKPYHRYRCQNLKPHHKVDRVR